jgi:hypothetical protein
LAEEIGHGDFQSGGDSDEGGAPLDVLAAGLDLADVRLADAGKSGEDALCHAASA